MAKAPGRNASKVATRIEEAIAVLRSLGLPKKQQQERSGLTLLAMLELKPTSAWKDASKPLIGITPMMEFFATFYGKRYKPNTRETVRRQTIYQFEQAGLIVANPDKPRPINSPDFVYQIEASTLELLRTYGRPDWQKNLEAYFSTRETLSVQYAAERVMHNIPVQLPQGGKLVLSPGGQNILIKAIIEKFCPRYTPGGQVLYVGDARDKHAVSEAGRLASLGIKLDKHGKMPDVVVFHEEKNWLVLIEAVTNHGPVNPKRHNELKYLFRFSKVGLVYVTAFLNRRAMTKYLPDIAWETEVWVADAPSHLIHFNGERFLGPYEGAVAAAPTRAK